MKTATGPSGKRR